jgi:hypothetical protein
MIGRIEETSVIIRSPIRASIPPDLIDRLLRDVGATQHGQRAAILIFKCSIN